MHSCKLTIRTLIIFVMLQSSQKNWSTFWKHCQLLSIACCVWFQKPRRSLMKTFNFSCKKSELGDLLRSNEKYEYFRFCYLVLMASFLFIQNTQKMFLLPILQYFSLSFSLISSKTKERDDDKLILNGWKIFTEVFFLF